MQTLEPYKDRKLPERFLRWIETLRITFRKIPSFFIGDGSPEGVISGAQSDRYYDRTADILYYKTTDGSDTGWLPYSSMGLTFVTVTTTPYTVGTESVVLVDDDAVGGTATINLAPAATVARKKVYIKKLGTTGSVIVDADGAETIDSGLTATLLIQHEAITIMCDATEWWVL